MALKPSEYGGSDTTKTQGIQAAPHTMTPSEQLRVMYNKDPMDQSVPTITDPVVQVNVPPLQVP